MLVSSCNVVTSLDSTWTALATLSSASIPPPPRFALFHPVVLSSLCSRCISHLQPAPPLRAPDTDTRYSHTSALRFAGRRINHILAPTPRSLSLPALVACCLAVPASRPGSCLVPGLFRLFVFPLVCPTACQSTVSARRLDQTRPTIHLAPASSSPPSSVSPRLRLESRDMNHG